MRSKAATGTPVRRQASATERNGARPAMRSACACARPFTMRRPSRNAAPSSVQSHWLALMQMGRISTPCSDASRTTCAGA